MDNLYDVMFARGLEGGGGGGFTPTQSQLDAMNSGITEELVTQIGTNETNILSIKGEPYTERTLIENIRFPYTNKQINSSTGELSDKNGQSVSDFIPISSTEIVYRIEAASSKNIMAHAFYDSNKVYISGVPTTSTYTTDTYQGNTVYLFNNNLPTNAKYIRIGKSDSVTSVTYMYDKWTIKNALNGFGKYDKPVSAMVTFIDDDFRNDCLTNWEEIADATGIKPVFAVRTNKVGLTQDSPTWDDIDRTRNKGFEYVSHTHNHIYLDEETDETIVADFQATIAALRAHNCTSDVLVYPGGRINAHVKELTKHYFKCGVTVGLKLQTPPLDDFQINRVSFVDSNDTEEIEVEGQTYTVYRVLSLTELKEIVDDAIDRGGWLIFMSHFRNTLTDGYYFNDTIKQRVIDLIKYIGSKNVHITTFSEGYEKIKNVVSCGILTDSSHYIVDCNGRVYT